MVRHKFSAQVRPIAAESVVLDGETPDFVAKKLRNVVSSRTVFRYAAQLRLTGTPLPPHSGKTQGRPRQLSSSMVNSMLELLTHHPTSLDLLQDHLLLDYGIHVPYRTIARYLKRARWSFRRLESRAMETDPLKVAAFLLQRPLYTPEMYWCMDETHIDDKVANLRYGYGRKGKRIVVLQPLKKGDSYSAVALLTTSRLMDVPVIQGGYTAVEILEMLELYVRPLPRPRSVVYWDNPTVHRNPQVLAAIAAHDMVVFNTPPYCPQWQPCEFVFGAMKNKLRRERWRLEDPEGCFVAIQKLMKSVVPDAATAQRFMWHAGVRVY
ncbi:hypothetical protein JCM11641_007063 [Rhodosporidiobolus odoratus]